MKKLFIAALMLSVATMGYSQKNFIDQNYIEVSGYNKTEVEPNMIFVNFQIKESDTKGKTSVAQQESSAIKELEKLGIDVKKKLVINNMSSDFMKYVLKKQDVMLAKSYSVETNSAASATAVFKAVENIGISNATIGRIDHSDIEALRLASKVDAVKAAKVKAEAEANAVGCYAGMAIYIQDIERPYVPYNMPMLTRSSMMADTTVQQDLPTLEFQKIVIESNVIVYFTLVQRLFNKVK